MCVYHEVSVMLIVLRPTVVLSCICNGEVKGACEIHDVMRLSMSSFGGIADI